MNGVSKKLTISIIGVQAIITMAHDSDEKFAFACLITGIVVAYKLVQCWADTRKPLTKGKD